MFCKTHHNRQAIARYNKKRKIAALNKFHKQKNFKYLLMITIVAQGNFVHFASKLTMKKILLIVIVIKLGFVPSVKAFVFALVA
jgi:hypothetical protein